MRSLLLLLAACTGKDSPSEELPTPESPFSQEERRRIERMGFPESSPPESPTNAFADDAEAAVLGQLFFYDERLSADGSVSCATCHKPTHGFADETAFSVGIAEGDRNAPGLIGAAWGEFFFWDGRTDSLWSQALGPLEHPAEHGFSRLELVHHLTSDTEQRELYQTIFGPLPDTTGWPDRGMPGDPEFDALPESDQSVINEVFANFGKAVEAFERKLVPGRAPFDDYIEGVVTSNQELQKVFSDDEVEGLRLFVSRAGCHFCHFGPRLTNEAFHNLGFEGSPDSGRFGGIDSLLKDPFNGAGEFSDAPGVGAERLDRLAMGAEQLGQFKVPSLRGVELTGPYFHNGSRKTLEEVVSFYNELPETPEIGHVEEQLVPLNLTDREVDQIAAFLRTLTPYEPLDESLLGPL